MLLEVTGAGTATAGSLGGEVRLLCAGKLWHPPAHITKFKKSYVLLEIH